jgi:hypothetical protein
MATLSFHSRSAANPKSGQGDGKDKNPLAINSATPNCETFSSRKITDVKIRPDRKYTPLILQFQLKLPLQSLDFIVAAPWYIPCTGTCDSHTQQNQNKKELLHGVTTTRVQWTL